MNQIEPGVQYNYVYDEDEYMIQEEEWDRDLLLDPAWEKQQRKVSRCPVLPSMGRTTWLWVPGTPSTSPATPVLEHPGSLDLPQGAGWSCCVILWSRSPSGWGWVLERGEHVQGARTGRTLVVVYARAHVYG